MNIHGACQDSCGSGLWTTHTHTSPSYLCLPCLQSKWGLDCYVSADHSLKRWAWSQCEGGSAEEKTLPFPPLSPSPFFSRPAQSTRPHCCQPINYCTVSDSHISHLQVISNHKSHVNLSQNMAFPTQTDTPNHTDLSWSTTEKLV